MWRLFLERFSRNFWPFREKVFYFVVCKNKCRQNFRVKIETIFIFKKNIFLDKLVNANYTFLYNKTIFFWLSLNFLNITLEIRLRFSQYFFLIFISLFSSIVYLIRFNTNNKHHFLNNGETKEFKIVKKAKIFSIL